MERKSFAAAFFTDANLRAIGKNLDRIYPIDESPVFSDLLAAIDRAQRAIKRPR